MTKCRPIIPNQNVARLKQAEIFQIQDIIQQMKRGFPRLPADAQRASEVRVARKQALKMNICLTDYQHLSQAEIEALITKAI